MFNVKGEPLGNAAQTKKGGFVRKFLIMDPQGKKQVITVHAQTIEPLAGEGVREIAIRQDFFFSAA